MKDDSNRPHEPGDALEARITAWVLGEASPFEAAELERLCAERPELKKFAKQVGEIHAGMLAAKEEGGGDWKLPEAKRRKIEALFGPEAAGEVPVKVVALPVRRTGRRMLLATAACAMLGTGFWFYLDRPGPLLAERSADAVPGYTAPSPVTKPASPPVELRAELAMDSRGAIARQEDRVEDAKKALAAVDRSRNEPTGRGLPALSPEDARELYEGRERELERMKLAQRSGETGSASYGEGWRGGGPVPGQSTPPPAAMSAQPVEGEPSLAKREEPAGGLRSGSGVIAGANFDSLPGDAPMGGLKRDLASDSPARAYGGRAVEGTPLQADGVPPAAEAQAASPPVDAFADGADFSDLGEMAKRSDPPARDPDADTRFTMDLGENLYFRQQESRATKAARELRELGKYDAARKILGDELAANPGDDGARRELERVEEAFTDYFRTEADPTRAELLAQVDSDWKLSVPAEDEMTEREKAEPQETGTAAEPFSTFSLNVSDASFRLAAAALERGEIPDPAGIRPEEFYNAFDYGDPAPADGEPVACAIVQSAHPALPQRNLLRIGVRTAAQGRGASTPLHLTLLVDGSGSMEREDRRAGLELAVARLAELLKEGDSVSVISFSRQPRLLADRLSGREAAKLPELIVRTPSEGGTNLEEGLKLAGEVAARRFQAGASNRIVLFTDGAANLGDADPASLERMIGDFRQRGIAFDAAGFGAAGLNDGLLERLTRHGNGRYHVVDKPEDADAGFAAKLAGAFRPAAEDVKVQVRFNPARVARYRLIGFGSHRLAKEDFRNDAVDAAEMAAEESGNALYQIEVLPRGEGEIGEVSVRFRDSASGAMVERSWTIPHDPRVPAFDEADPSVQLAGLAAFAAAKLRGEALADAVDFQQLAPALGSVKARYPESRQVAALEAMIGKLK